MTDEAPDYTTMSGAEFQRAVGVDPEKWAEALSQMLTKAAPPGSPSAPLLTGWFRDAMDAARRDGMRLVGSGVTGKTVPEGE